MMAQITFFFKVKVQKVGVQFFGKRVWWAHSQHLHHLMVQETKKDSSLGRFQFL